jgi:hypothetical protein
LYNFVFVPGHHPRFETYTNLFPCHIANPFCAAKKGGQKSNPVNQNFAQLTKKIEKLEKALKKSGKKGKKRHYKDSNSNSE